MTFAPASLKALDAYLKANAVTTLGIVGDAAHAARQSYHNGQDRIAAAGRTAANDYSIRHPRDLEPALTNAASAIDLGKVTSTLKGLQKLSNWLATECQNRALDTLDVREVIYSPDGTAIRRWDATNPNVLAVGGTGTGQGDDSHRTHTHISYFRDAEFRDHTALFRRYWEDEVITAIKGEDWKPTVTNGVSNGVYRATPERAAPLVARLGADSVIRTIAEISADGNNWRLSEVGGVPAYFLRGDLAPLVPGGDAGVDGALTDYINRIPVPPVIDCTPLVNAARAEGVAAGLRDGSRAVKDAAVNAAVLLGG